MVNYSWISVLSLVCYLFLFTAFSAAKKNRVIHSFMLIQVLMVLWTGGSFFMRSQLFPGVNFWHYVSVLGVLLLPYGILRFFLDFLDDKRDCGKTVCLVAYLAAFVFNLFTGLFIPTPEVVMAQGIPRFVYHYTSLVFLLLLPSVMLFVQIVGLCYRHCKGNSLVLRQLFPILLGAVGILLGHALATLPLFSGFPLDVLSGLVFAALTFYALYQKKLFQMKLLISRGNCYAMALVLCLLGASNSAVPLRQWLLVAGVEETAALIIMGLIFMLSILVLYRCLQKFLDRLFTKEEHLQAKAFQSFGLAISRTLQLSEILDELLSVLQGSFPGQRVFLCIQEEGGGYAVKRTSSPLDGCQLALSANHPLAEYMRQRDGCLLMEDFCRTQSYRSLWEQEKRQLSDWDVACLAPLRDGADLVGLVMVSSKPKQAAFHYDDLSFLSSVASVCAMAVKNARLYEKAYAEARNDSLTGLLNRKCFYEIIEQEFPRERELSLALVLLSVDDFKLYNQLYGAREGDISLQRVAQIIQSSVADRGYAFRMDSKEFALLLPNYDISSAKLLAEGICTQVRHLEARSEHCGMKTLTMSGGVCAAPYLAGSVDELIANADLAVYSVKRAGKNAVVMYSEEVEHRHSDMEKNGMRSGNYDDYASTIYALTAAIDAKDHYTFGHSQNVAYYAVQLARAYGLNEEYIDTVREAALLHDIGKIGVSEMVLNKPGTLDAEEYRIMKSHVEHSIDIIRHLPSLDYVIPAVLSHHERYDGFGYPRGLGGEDIPLMGRILCVADSFDAMVSQRSYKAAMPVDAALSILREECGQQFDPKLAELFITLVQSSSIQMQKRGVQTEFSA